MILCPSVSNGHGPAVLRPESKAPAALSPFDEMAATYDTVFTRSLVGRLMRQAVWRRLDACFHAGDRVLELGCGTGEDAVYLAQRGVDVLATDASLPMVEAAREKVASLGLESRIEVRSMAVEALHNADSPPPLLGSRSEIGSLGKRSAGAFDGALSNFGGLNCVADLAGIREGLAACLRPRATAVLCIMGPVCPWEWIWFAAKGQPRKAFRRLRRGGATWRGLTIHYPTPRDVGLALRPDFRVRRLAGVGALVPPSFAEEWAKRHQDLVLRLDQWERRHETLPILSTLADHFLIELERL